MCLILIKLIIYFNLNIKNIIYIIFEHFKIVYLSINIYKPFIRFEPMTYALPWRYSTTELKGQF